MSMRRSATQTGWASGLTAFAGIVLAIVGVLQALEGLAALVDDTFFVTARGNIYAFDLTSWGWIHLILGLLVAATGVGLLMGQTWARLAGIFLAALAAISQFMFLPYYPIWSIVVIALDIAVIWALCVYAVGDER